MWLQGCKSEIIVFHWNSGNCTVTVSLHPVHICFQKQHGDLPVAEKDWCELNQLQLNIQKTTELVVDLWRSQSPVTCHPVQISNHHGQCGSQSYFSHRMTSDPLNATGNPSFLSPSDSLTPLSVTHPHNNLYNKPTAPSCIFITGLKLSLCENQCALFLLYAIPCKCAILPLYVQYYYLVNSFTFY